MIKHCYPIGEVQNKDDVIMQQGGIVIIGTERTCIFNTTERCPSPSVGSVTSLSHIVNQRLGLELGLV